MIENNDHTICDNITNVNENVTDVVTEETAAKSDNFGKKVAIGTGVGILLGVGTAAAAHHFSGETVPDEDVVVESEVKVAESVNDNMSFSEAFEAARDEVGPGGVFHWHGNSYSTYSESEWNSMSEEERADYGERVKPEVQGDKNLTSQHTEHHTTTTVEHHHVTASHHHDNEDQIITVKPEDPDVELIGVEDEVLADGSVVTVGAATVNGHNVVVVDVDHDTVFDVAYVDANDNGTIDRGETIDISDSHLTVNEFSHIGGSHTAMETHHEDLASNDVNTGYDDNGMPDYMNDADVLV